MDIYLLNEILTGSDLTDVPGSNEPTIFQYAEMLLQLIQVGPIFGCIRVGEEDIDAAWRCLFPFSGRNGDEVLFFGHQSPSAAGTELGTRRERLVAESAARVVIELLIHCISSIRERLSSSYANDCQNMVVYMILTDAPLYYFTIIVQYKYGSTYRKVSDFSLCSILSFSLLAQAGTSSRELVNHDAKDLSLGELTHLSCLQPASAVSRPVLLSAGGTRRSRSRFRRG